MASTRKRGRDATESESSDDDDDDDDGWLSERLNDHDSKRQRRHSNFAQTRPAIEDSLFEDQEASSGEGEAGGGEESVEAPAQGDPQLLLIPTAQIPLEDGVEPVPIVSSTTVPDTAVIAAPSKVTTKRRRSEDDTEEESEGGSDQRETKELGVAVRDAKRQRPDPDTTNAQDIFLAGPRPIHGVEVLKNAAVEDLDATSEPREDIPDEHNATSPIASHLTQHFGPLPERPSLVKGPERQNTDTPGSPKLSPRRLRSGSAPAIVSKVDYSPRMLSPRELESIRYEDIGISSFLVRKQFLDDYPSNLLPPPLLCIRCLFCRKVFQKFTAYKSKASWKSHMKSTHKFEFPTRDAGTICATRRGDDANADVQQEVPGDEHGTLEPISETSPQDTNGKTDPSSLEHGAATTSLVLPPTSITVSLSESNHRELKVVSNSSSSDDTKEEGIEGAAEEGSTKCAVEDQVAHKGSLEDESVTAIAATIEAEAEVLGEHAGSGPEQPTTHVSRDDRPTEEVVPDCSKDGAEAEEDESYDVLRNDRPVGEGDVVSDCYENDAEGEPDSPTAPIVGRGERPTEEFVSDCSKDRVDAEEANDGVSGEIVQNYPLVGEEETPTDWDDSDAEGEPDQSAPIVSRCDSPTGEFVPDCSKDGAEAEEDESYDVPQNDRPVGEGDVVSDCYENDAEGEPGSPNTPVVGEVKKPTEEAVPGCSKDRVDAVEVEDDESDKVPRNDPPATEEEIRSDSPESDAEGEPEQASTPEASECNVQRDYVGGSREEAVGSPEGSSAIEVGCGPSEVQSMRGASTAQVSQTDAEMMSRVELVQSSSSGHPQSHELGLIAPRDQPVHAGARDFYPSVLHGPPAVAAEVTEVFPNLVFVCAPHSDPSRPALQPPDPGYGESVGFLVPLSSFGHRSQGILPGTHAGSAPFPNTTSTGLAASGSALQGSLAGSQSHLDFRLAQSHAVAAPHPSEGWMANAFARIAAQPDPAYPPPLIPPPIVVPSSFPDIDPGAASEVGNKYRYDESDFEELGHRESHGQRLADKPQAAVVPMEIEAVESSGTVAGPQERMTSDTPGQGPAYQPQVAAVHMDVEAVESSGTNAVPEKRVTADNPATTPSSEMRDPKPVKKQPKSGLVSRTVYKMPAHSKPKGPPPPEVGLDSIEPERLDYLSLYATARLRPDEFKTKDYPKYLMPPPRLSLIKCLFCDETITGFDKKTARQMWMQHQKRIHKFKFPTKPKVKPTAPFQNSKSDLLVAPASACDDIQEDETSSENPYYYDESDYEGSGEDEADNATRGSLLKSQSPKQGPSPLPVVSQGWAGTPSTSDTANPRNITQSQVRTTTAAAGELSLASKGKRRMEHPQPSTDPLHLPMGSSPSANSGGLTVPMDLGGATLHIVPPGNAQPNRNQGISSTFVLGPRDVRLFHPSNVAAAEVKHSSGWEEEQRRASQQQATQQYAVAAGSDTAGSGFLAAAGSQPNYRNNDPVSVFGQQPTQVAPLALPVNPADASKAPPLPAMGSTRAEAPSTSNATRPHDIARHQIDKLNAATAGGEHHMASTAESWRERPHLPAEPPHFAEGSNPSAASSSHLIPYTTVNLNPAGGLGGPTFPEKQPTSDYCTGEASTSRSNATSNVAAEVEAPPASGNQEERVSHQTPSQQDASTSTSHSGGHSDKKTSKRQELLKRLRKQIEETQAMTAEAVELTTRMSALPGKMQKLLQKARGTGN